MTGLGKTPTLRFREFNREWKIFEFADLAMNKKGKYSSASSDESYKDIELENIESETGMLINFFDSKDHRSLKTRFEEGDILFGKLRPYLKKYLKAPFNGVCSTEIWVLSGKIITNDLLLFIIQTDKFNKVANIQSGSKMPRADWSIVGASTYALPSNREEQDKIAAFLTEVHNKVFALQTKKQLLEKYKKNVMQAIFSQKIRFKAKDGKNYPEWEKKYFRDVVLVVMGQSPDSSAYNVVGDGLVLIQGNADIKNRRTVARLWTRIVTKKCDIGDIILTVRAPSGYVAISKHSACLGRGVCSIKPKANVSRSFVYQYLLWFEPKWISIEQGSTFTAISGEDIRTLSLNMPSEEEQQKIADFLTSIDNKIDLTKKELEQTKKFKQALLQQMFV